MRSFIVDDLIAFCDYEPCLQDEAWQAARKTLDSNPDLDAVVVMPAVGSVLWQRCFEETWIELPFRLAALAIEPFAGSGLLIRASRAITFQPPSDVTRQHRLWWQLIELTKRGRLIRIQTTPRVVDAGRSDSVPFMPELVATSPRSELAWLFREIAAWTPRELGGLLASPPDGTAILAGLWLLHGDADRSHQCAQTIEDAGRQRSGNYWHAIMHRQEPDYGNSKYWFRRIGPHSILPELASRADELIAGSGVAGASRWRAKLGLPGNWDSRGFVDWCESVVRQPESSEATLVRQIQFEEIHLLLRASWLDATEASLAAS